MKMSRSDLNKTIDELKELRAAGSWDDLFKAIDIVVEALEQVAKGGGLAITGETRIVPEVKTAATGLEQMIARAIEQNPALGYTSTSSATTASVTAGGITSGLVTVALKG